MILFVVAAVSGIAVTVGVAFGWKFVVAPLLGALVWAWGTATLRSFRRGAHGVALDGEGPPVVEEGVAHYWCEECGLDVLVLVDGTGLPPRHCGERMHRRVELST